MQMILHFGHDFDGPVFSGAPARPAGSWHAGLRGVLSWLEQQTGRGGQPEDTDYLRIELYRQALQQQLAECLAQPLFAEPPFYHRSLQTDSLAVAAALLDWRDELLLAGWNFGPADALPPRLRTLAAVEAIFRRKIDDPEFAGQAWGWADRFEQALRALEGRRLPLEKVLVYDPEDLLPPPATRLLARLRALGVAVEPVHPEPSASPHTRLGHLQRRILHRVSGKMPAKPEADPSLLVLTSRRDSDAAVFLAQLLSRNPAFRPLFLLPELNLMFEEALVQEGLPALGVLSSSLARPSLQVLKLAPAFLWEPVDVFKMMEFMTLPLKPFDDGLAQEIARVLAEKPGLYSDTWFAAVLSYLERPGLSAKARAHYEFWFDRRRYSSDGTAPKRDAIGIYAYLRTWALAHFEETGSKNTSLLVLAEQARRIRDLLEALPESRLTFLELERIVRTIYEPSPMQLTEAEEGHLPFIHQPGALASPAGTVLWWNCLFTDTAAPPDRWRRDERAWLAGAGAPLQTVRQESQLRLMQQQKPVLLAADQLILMVPEQADGAEQAPGLLLGDVEAAFEDCRAFRFCLDHAADRDRLSALFSLPGTARLAARAAARHQPQLLVRRPDLVTPSDYETPTQLESLFYYPHRWFFRQKMRLFPASLLSVTRDQTLHGSLAHRFFELLLKEDFYQWDREAVYDWIHRHAAQLLEREGATLMLYGREPERTAFLARVKNAAWSLIASLRSNGWTVVQTELELSGTLGGMPVRGKADLVLERGSERAIVDLKWSGARRRREMIQNGEDLQLVLYARWLPPEEQWAHTAYFILEDGKMIARNRAAFSEAITAGTCDDHGAVCAQIYARMEKTFAWRMQQLFQGRLELRTARTAAELDDLYADTLFDLLEMKREDGRWDSYKTLLDAGF
jgi:hypothetical protein